MKKILALLALVVAAAFAVEAQGLSKAAGVYDSTMYKYWGAAVAIGNSATGSQTITVCPAIQSLPDGRQFQPFASANSTFSPFTIDAGTTNAETVTPTASALVAPPSGYPNNIQCAQVTASFSNTHGSSANAFQVISGDQGIQEAITDAALNGGGLVFWRIDPGIVTLNTGGANTNLGSVKIPTHSVVMHASANVTTTITSCSGGWSLGYSSGTEFTAAQTTLTAGTTTDTATGASNMTLPVAMVAAATIPINKCTTSNASAGAIHATFSGYKIAAPAF
jgi:hypothetical protein